MRFQTNDLPSLLEQWEKRHEEEVYTQYRNWLQHDPNDPRIACAYGLTLTAEARHEEALVLLEQAVALSQEEYVVALLGVYELYAIGIGPEMTREAVIELFHRITNQFPRHRRACAIAEVQIGLMGSTSAERRTAYDRALLFDPECIEAYHNKAMDFWCEGNVVEAKECMKKVLSLSSQRGEEMPLAQIDMKRMEEGETCKCHQMVASVVSDFFKNPAILDEWLDT